MPLHDNGRQDKRSRTLVEPFLLLKDGRYLAILLLLHFGVPLLQSLQQPLLRLRQKQSSLRCARRNHRLLAARHQSHPFDYLLYAGPSDPHLPLFVSTCEYLVGRTLVYVCQRLRRFLVLFLWVMMREHAFRGLLTRMSEPIVQRAYDSWHGLGANVEPAGEDWLRGR